MAGMSRSASARRVLAVAAVALLAAGACTETGQTEGGALCTFGQVVPCDGPNECAGEQVCLDDLSGYSECECGDGAPPLPPTDAGADGDAG
jgi:hypothetical protein